MKIRHIVFSLLPAIAVADSATTVPDDEPLLPPLPEELLSPQAGQEGLPATACPVVSYRAPANEEQTWLKLFYIRGTDAWPDVFRRMASASHDKDMQMCHGYALWLKGQEILHLRYDDDLSLSGIHADGHAYGVLFVEFNPYGIRVCPMEGYDLSGKNGGVCWQDASTRLWSWAEAEAFWGELPKLLRYDKGRATSAQDTAVKREVATKGQRMVIFWAPAGYPASAWWPSFARLHAAVGDRRFSLIAPDGLKLWADVTVPTVRGSAAAPVALPPPVSPAPPATAVTPSTPGVATGASTPPGASPTPSAAPAPAGAATGAATGGALPVAPAPPSGGGARSTSAQAPAPSAPSAVHQVPEQLQPGSGSTKDVAPPASVRPWELTGEAAPTATPAQKPTATSPVAPAGAAAPQTAQPTAPANPAAAPATGQAAPATPATPAAPATRLKASATPPAAPVATPAEQKPAAEPPAKTRTLNDVSAGLP